MIAITAYQAHDGKRFFERAECEQHEDYLERASKALAGLKPRPTRMPDGTYIQQDIDAIWAARAALIEASDLDADTKQKIAPFLADRSLPSFSIIGRWLDGHGPIESAWWRLECIDALGREWQQPYFVTHPDEGHEYQAPTP